MKSGYLILLFAVVSMLVLPQSALFGIPQSDGEAPVIIIPFPLFLQEARAVFPRWR
ncbi:MAG: hypothetical protein J6W09_05375 [Bacteroidales bacterium]|nr:hypothetical protein [Bacteroidales bacterium]